MNRFRREIKCRLLVHAKSKLKNIQVTCRNTPDTNEARGLKNVRAAWKFLRMSEAAEETAYSPGVVSLSTDK